MKVLSPVHIPPPETINEEFFRFSGINIIKNATHSSAQLTNEGEITMKTLWKIRIMRCDTKHCSIAVNVSKQINFHMHWFFKFFGKTLFFIVAVPCREDLSSYYTTLTNVNMWICQWKLLKSFFVNFLLPSFNNSEISELKSRVMKKAELIKINFQKKKTHRKEKLWKSKQKKSRMVNYDISVSFFTFSAFVCMFSHQIMMLTVCMLT